jgi:hypothetical protein
MYAMKKDTRKATRKDTRKDLKKSTHDQRPFIYYLGTKNGAAVPG